MSLDDPTYRCPVCGTTNPYGYLDCFHPNCTDGRDPPTRVVIDFRDPRPRFKRDTTTPPIRLYGENDGSMALFWWLVIVVGIALLGVAYIALKCAEIVE